MVDKIGGPTHNILIAEDSSQAIRADTEKALTGLTKAKRGSDDKSTVLSQSTWQRRLVSIPKRLTGSYGTYVKQQNELVKTAFAKALGVNSRDIAGAGAAHKAIFKSLDQRIAKLNSSKDILTFNDLEEALSVGDAAATKQLQSYLPASNGKKSLVDVPSDGSQFTFLATKHHLDSPEQRERFRTGFEGILYGIANKYGGGTAAEEIEQIAEVAAARARFAEHPPIDKPVTEIWNEFPTGFAEEKFLNDGKFQAQGQPESGGAQNFVYFKRVNDAGIPYDLQQYADLKAAQNGAPEKASTPAAKGQLADAKQKFHISVPAETLANNKAWDPIHRLLTSDESPFNQWKISNVANIQKDESNWLEQLDKEYQ